MNQSPWAIGTAWYDQRDLYTTSSEIDASGYGRGPSYHPEEGSYAYPRHTEPNEQSVDGGDASLYEKEAWPWLVYKATAADPYFAFLRAPEPRWRGFWKRLQATALGVFGRRADAERRSDARIRADVEDALWFTGDLDSTDIRVDVEAGAVTLEGTVADRSSKELAAAVVRGVRGVRAVHNHLDIRHDDTSSAGIAFVPA